MSFLIRNRFIISCAISIILIGISFLKKGVFVNKNTSKIIARSGVFASISVILYLVEAFNFRLPFFPSFLQIHIDEVPAFIAGFAYGPLSAVLVIVVKTIVKLPLSGTLCVGEVVDLIYSLAFVIPASIIYRKRRNFGGVIIGLSTSTLIQLVISCLCTTFIMVPFYMNIIGMSEGILLSLSSAANSNIHDLTWSFMLYAVLPFNVLKDAVVILMTIILYKGLHKLIDRIGA